MSDLDKTILRLLTHDDISRRLRQFKLLSEADMEEVWRQTSDLRISETETCTKSLVLSKYHYVKKRYNYYNDVYSNRKASYCDMKIKMVKVIDEEFPFISDLLKKFSNRIVAAGGAIFKAVQGLSFQDSADIDLFFINKNSDISAINSTTDMLAEALAFLIEKFLNKDNLNDPKYYVHRNEYVTTLFLTSIRTTQGNYSTKNIHKYQFIHRIYPDVGSILGGFDLGPCMIAYDGKNLLATELGAWSAFAKIVLVDTKRRSTSFEHRLMKYNKNCIIIFPGLLKTIINNINKPNIMSKKTMKSIIKAICKYKGYKYHTNRDYNKITKRPTKEPISLLELKQKISIEISDAGYEIDKTKFNSLFEECVHPTPKSMSKPIDLDELNNYLVDVCHMFGYRFDIDEQYFVESAGSTAINLPKLLLNNEPPFLMFPRHYPMRSDVQSLLQDPQFIKYFEQKNYHQTSLIKDSAISRINKTIKFVSDYDDNQIYPDFIDSVNSTQLRCNKLNTICSIFQNTIDVTLKQNLLKQELLNSFVNPYIGSYQDKFNEMLAAFHNRYLSNAQFFCHNLDLLKERLTRLFAEYANEVFDDIMKHKDEISPPVRPSNKNKARQECRDKFTQLLTKWTTLMSERMNQNAVIVNKNLIGIKWITENPGRQWTASINPIIENPREWYGEYYTSFRTGKYETELTLNLIFKHAKQPTLLRLLNKDLFKIIQMKIALA